MKATNFTKMTSTGTQNCGHSDVTLIFPLPVGTLTSNLLQEASLAEKHLYRTRSMSQRIIFHTKVHRCRYHRNSTSDVSTSVYVRTHTEHGNNTWSHQTSFTSLLVLSSGMWPRHRIHRRLGGTHCLHILGQEVSQATRTKQMYLELHDSKFSRPLYRLSLATLGTWRWGQ